MRKASVHKIGSDAFRVSFMPEGVEAVAEIVVSTDGRARNVKRTYQTTGNVPDGVTSLLATAAA